MPFVHEQLTANGTTSLGRIVASKAILDIVTRDHVLTIASIVNGGAGYVVGETFDLGVGGTVAGSALYPARGVVEAVDGAGAVTSARIASAGAYDTLPEGAVSTTNASLAGDDALTVTVTTQTSLWTADREDYVDDATDFHWIATSVKSTNAPTVGLRTIVSGSNGGMQMLAATGFDDTQLFEGQPNANPVTLTIINAPGTDPEVYLSITERRLTIMIRNGNFVQYGQIGLFIPFTDNDANYPLPLCAFGQTRQLQAFSAGYLNTNQGNGNAGVVNPTKESSLDNNATPYYYLDNLSSTWLIIAEDTNHGLDEARSQIWPANQVPSKYDFVHAPQVSGKSTDPLNSSVGAGILADAKGSSPEGWFNGGANGAGNQGRPGVAPFGTSGRSSFLVQPHIISNRPDNAEIIGILDGLQAVHGRGLTAFEDLVDTSGQRFVVFPDTNTSELQRWVAMERV